MQRSTQRVIAGLLVFVMLASILAVIFSGSADGLAALASLR